MIFNNRNICLHSKPFFDVELFQKGIFQASDIIVGGHLRPVSYYHNRGYTADNLLRIQIIFSVIKQEWIRSDFMVIDIENFQIELMIFGYLHKFMDFKIITLLSNFKKSTR